MSQVVAHEIAHNIGIRHDFNDADGIRTPREGCDSTNSIMNYVQKRTSWSDCTVKDFRRLFSLEQNQECMDCKLHFTRHAHL